MARFANRIAYRVAGLVWTALYAGLCRNASSSVADGPLSIRVVESIAEQPAIAA